MQPDGEVKEVSKPIDYIMEAIHSKFGLGIEHRLEKDGKKDQVKKPQVVKDTKFEPFEGLLLNPKPPAKEETEEEVQLSQNQDLIDRIRSSQSKFRNRHTCHLTLEQFHQIFHSSGLLSLDFCVQLFQQVNNTVDKTANQDMMINREFTEICNTRLIVLKEKLNELKQMLKRSILVMESLFVRNIIKKEQAGIKDGSVKDTYGKIQVT